MQNILFCFESRMSATSQAQAEFIMKVLSHIPVFSLLSKDEQAKLSAHMRVETFKKGSNIVSEQEHMPFLIIWKGNLVLSGEQKILQKGDYLGEEALVNKADHTAKCTVQCATDSQILCISQAQFSVCLPEVYDALEITV